MSAAMRAICLAVFACKSEPLTGKTQGSCPRARICGKSGPESSRQPTSTENPFGLRRRRSTNWRSAPPPGGETDARFWGRTRNFYEALTRFSQFPAVRAPLGALVKAITAIPPPWPARDRSGPTAGTRWMVRAAKSGAGVQLARHPRETGAPLVTTFYAAAILAEL